MFLAEVSSKERRQTAGVSGLAALGLFGCAPATNEKTGAQSSAVEGSSSGTAAESRTPGYCGPGDWLGEAPVIDDADIVDEKTFDVVVLGGGHAGLMAACGAVDEGATVAVVEMQPWSSYVDLDGSGTNMAGWYGEDIGHVNSQFLIERGFGPFNTGEITAEFCKRAGGRVNPDIIRAFVQNSGAMVDRYKEIYDSYEARAQSQRQRRVHERDGCCHPRRGRARRGHLRHVEHVRVPVVQHAVGMERRERELPHRVRRVQKRGPATSSSIGYQGNNIEYVHKYIVQHTQENGAEWFFEHTGVVLEQSDSGDVTGLIAEGPDGYVRFNASKGVVLAAGDFIGDPAMCWALLNEGMEWAERSGMTRDEWVQTGFRTGIAHKMGCWAGGMIEPTPRGWMGLGGGADGPWGVAPLLMLNVNGKRFMNEGSIAQYQPTCMRQPAGLACWVTDANWKNIIGKSPLDHGGPNFGMDDYMTRLEADMAAVEVGNPEGSQVIQAKLAERKMMQGTVFAANTLEELAELLGYTGDAAATFVESVEHYNELCNSADGDTDYGKDKAFMQAIDTPPFYGGTSELSHETKPSMVTMSGPRHRRDAKRPAQGRLDAHQGLVRCRQLPGRALRLRLQHAVRGQLGGHGDDPRLAGRPHGGQLVAANRRSTATFLPLLRKGPVRGAFPALGAAFAAKRRSAATPEAEHKGRGSVRKARQRGSVQKA